MLHGHGKTVQSVAFTADGRYIISGSEDFTIRKWDLETACKLALESSDHPVSLLASATLQDGWLLGPSGELVAWIPAEYRGYLQVVPCTLRIDKSRAAVAVGDSGLYAGANWASCWHDSAV